MPNYIVLKNVHSMLIYEFQQFSTHKAILKNDKAKFNVVLREYLIHTAISL